MSRPCASCRFWNRSEDDAQNRRERACRCHPPSVLVDAASFEAYTVWPMTQPDDWCGEYQPATRVPKPPLPASDVGGLGKRGL